MIYLEQMRYYYRCWKYRKNLKASGIKTGPNPLLRRKVMSEPAPKIDRKYILPYEAPKYFRISPEGKKHVLKSDRQLRSTGHGWTLCGIPIKTLHPYEEDTPICVACMELEL